MRSWPTAARWTATTKNKPDVLPTVTHANAGGTSALHLPRERLRDVPVFAASANLRPRAAISQDDSRRTRHPRGMTNAAAVMTQRRFSASYCERATLTDGTSVELRPIRPADAPLLQAGLRQLSERTRYLRFHAPRGEFSPDELRLLTDVDGETHFALAAFTLQSQRLVAVGRFIRSSAAEAAAELALVVGDALQGKGLGRLLLSRLREAALEREVTRFTGTVLDENRPMRALLRKLGGHVGLASRGVCDIELALA
ncbi:MAG: GNAT family N-acetyltransferase [Deltaproteobacteria bacterium]|nr:MAG: GNAT family N-acetyltransferase [Deltaproteobacteria bacterium]